MDADNIKKKADFSICIEKRKGGLEHRLVFLRRGLKTFLIEMASLFDVVLYTTSKAAYAAAIVDYIDPKREYFSNVLTRIHCVEEPSGSGSYLKDLSRIVGRSLDQMLLLDDSQEQVELNKENAIRILAFGHDMGEDDELAGFTLLAQELAEARSV